MTISASGGFGSVTVFLFSFSSLMDNHGFEELGIGWWI